MAQIKTAPSVSYDRRLNDIPFHAKSIPDCLEILDTRLSGLTDNEVEARQEQYGYNIVSDNKAASRGMVFLKQFKNLVVILLFLASAISFYQKDYMAGFAILAAMLANAAIGVAMQWKALKSLPVLEAFSAPSCTVMRDGLTSRIPSKELVPGDIMVFNSGEAVPADARLMSSDGLQVDESALTGESVLINKEAMAVHLIDEDITERSNMIYAGTTIKTGSGQALITATGVNSQMGKIAALAQASQRREGYLTKGLNRFGILIFCLVAALTAVVVLMGLHQGHSAMEMAQLGIVLLVAGVPEILPSVAIFTLSMGVERLSQENTIIRNLHAIESIGSLTVICTDKTGTLTENSLSVHRIYVPEVGAMDYNPMWCQAKEVPCRSVEELLRVGRLNNTTILEGVRSFMMGDPIDVALYRATPAEYEYGYHRVRDYPFDSTTMRMATVYKRSDGQHISMIKGAPESIISVCDYYLKANGAIAPLDVNQKNEFLLGNQDIAMDGVLRVIGFAEKPMADQDDNPFNNGIFIGWVCLIDPPKPGVVEAIHKCQRAGLKVIMITGDQKATAAVMAKKLGILKEGDEVMTRRELDDGVGRIPSSVRVFARTQPEEKLAIVQSLQKSGEIVAMVGDGVNDAPALRQSDIAIAMGIRGSDAAKESADIILLNDRFETISKAVEEGRLLTHNIKLSIKYLISCNMALVSMMVVASLLGFGLPLTALQIIWLNIITVTLPALSLAFEPPSEAVLRHSTPSYRQGIFSGREIPILVFWSGLLLLAGLGAYLMSKLVFGGDAKTATTLCFTTLAFAQTLHLLNIQMAHSGQSKAEFFEEISQVPLTWIILISAVVLQLSVIYIPIMQMFLGTTAFAWQNWWIPIVFPGIMLLLAIVLVPSQSSDR